MTAQKPPSIWMYKPWWCQPWSIVLTGSALIGGCWLLLRVVWLTVLATIPVLIWMGFFLLVYPRLMQESGLLEELSQGDE